MLRPGGRLALHEILAGSVCPVHYPVPWASDSSTSFLVSPCHLRQTLDECGFLQSEWKDDTPISIEWARKPVDSSGSRFLPEVLDALLGPDSRERIENVRRNLIERRIEVVQAVYKTA